MLYLSLAVLAIVAFEVMTFEELGKALALGSIALFCRLSDFQGFTETLSRLGFHRSPPQAGISVQSISLGLVKRGCKTASRFEVATPYQSLSISLNPQ